MNSRQGQFMHRCPLLAREVSERIVKLHREWVVETIRKELFFQRCSIMHLLDWSFKYLIEIEKVVLVRHFILSCSLSSSYKPSDIQSSHAYYMLSRCTEQNGCGRELLPRGKSYILNKIRKQSKRVLKSKSHWSRWWSQDPPISSDLGLLPHRNS